MRKIAVTLMTSLLGSSAAFAFWPEATDSSLEIGVGYRQDTLQWSTSVRNDSSYYSDNYDCCEILKELVMPLADVDSHVKWKNLSIWQIEAKGKYVTCDNLYLRANADYGWITSGKNIDKDYVVSSNYSADGCGCGSGSGYNSGNEFEIARSKSSVSGTVYDAKIAVGYQFKWCDDSLAIAPLVGYSWHGQHFKDSHLQQEFFGDETVEVLGGRSYYSSYYYGNYSNDYSYDGCSYGGNNSSYHTRWSGPFIGFDFDYRFGCGCEAEWELFGSYEFHWASFNSKAHWVLIEDLVDGFKQHAKNAYGNVFNIGVKWDFCECWTLAVKGEFQWWWADRGHDRAELAEGRAGNVDIDCYTKFPVHNIKWNSASISVDLGMVF